MSTKPCLLLVDDDEDTREMYAWSLGARGFEVLGAGTAAQALSLADAHQPQVIVTDFTLPGEDGFALATRVRASSALADTPLVLVSGRAFVAGSGERAMQIFDRVLLKPVLPDHLLAEIVPLLLDRTAARLQRHLRAVRERVGAVPRGSEVSRVLAAISEVAGDGVAPAALLADGAARYIGVNDAACALTGRTRDELLASTVWDLVPPAAGREGRKQWAEFVANGRLAGAYRLQTPAGLPIDATFAAETNVLPGCHLSLLHPIPAGFIIDGPVL